MAWARIRGHDAARESFQRAFTLGRLGQAYLLVGPEGIGKRLFAVELAKALLCEHPPSPLSACDQCPSCAQVEAGTHPDVFFAFTPPDKHELPIETMREFCAQVAMKPSRGSRKVGIVVDADDFNPSSANIFLKTLEEPPPGSLLLLLATSLDRQLPTILSRCQAVHFATLRTADMRMVLKDQGVEPDAQIDRLVRLGAGSVSQALALNGEEFADVRDRLLGGLTSPRADFAALASTWSQFNEAAGKETAGQRMRASLVIRFLVEALQNALRLAHGAEVPGLEPHEAARLNAFAERLGIERLLELIDRCVQADYHVERRVQLILVVENVLEQFTRSPG